MKQRRSARQLIQMWRRRETAAVDRVTQAVADERKAASGVVHSAFTASGLTIEDQVRKAALPWPSGLAMF